MGEQKIVTIRFGQQRKIVIDLDEHQAEQLRTGNALPSILTMAKVEVATVLSEVIEAELRHEQCRGKLEITIAAVSVRPEAAETVSPAG